MITRHGKPAACLAPPSVGASAGPHPWEALRGSGALHAEPEVSMLEGQAFDALR